MATQPAAPAPVNPPDELGPPPPPPPPPANPPILNPMGVHFQPQVPGTEMGPMTHRYVPRHDPPGAPGMFFPGQQMPGLMANGAMVPMMQLPMGVAPVSAPMNPIVPPVHVEPAMGVGLTPNETMAQNIRIAQNNKAYEPQDFKPADPDPYRMYWFRELNNHWAVFPRRQIDRLNARWYRTDEGVFYAIRLSD
ncbi:hypothetical protein NEMBOFW57_000625 [Staphylotrichum longicolle]|uniref:Uncharacterized protein n=1 Tax=Staphylotrichum longicolle TaxID=669026 RepID=A0AAD4F019_9PEZI|nr:hypothetical protein NEMBOFW57_000625 [Staphylotrichum longicolle]